MKNRRKRKTIYIFLVTVTVAFLITVFLSMETMLLLPKGRFISDAVSPDADRIVKVYRCNEGATVDFAIRCEVSGKGLVTRNIYWQYHASEASVSWLDNDTVCINGILINVLTERYDYRHRRTAR